MEETVWAETLTSMDILPKKKGGGSGELHLQSTSEQAQCRESLGKENQEWTHSYTHKQEKISGMHCSPPNWQLAEAKCDTVPFVGFGCLCWQEPCKHQPVTIRSTNWLELGLPLPCRHSAIQQAQRLSDLIMGSLELWNYSPSSAGALH